MLSTRPWNLEGILRLMVGILFSVAFIIVLQNFILHFTGKAKFEEGSMFYILFSSLSVHGSILAGTAFAIWSQHLSLSDFFGFSKPALGRAFGYGAAATVAFIPVGMVLQSVSIRLITAYFHQAPEKQAAVEEFGKTVNWQSRAYLVFFAIVLAPIAEEILFRGIIYGILRQAGLPRFALWFSALIFAVSHASAAIFVPLVILGLIFAWLYDKTDNLLASITAHSLFNAINLVFLFMSDAVIRHF